MIWRLIVEGFLDGNKPLKRKYQTAIRDGGLDDEVQRQEVKRSLFSYRYNWKAMGFKQLHISEEKQMSHNRKVNSEGNQTRERDLTTEWIQVDQSRRMRIIRNCWIWQRIDIQWFWWGYFCYNVSSKTYIGPNHTSVNTAHFPVSLNIHTEQQHIVLLATLTPILR